MFFGDMNMRYLGVDLHTNCFTVCVRSESGKEKLATYRMGELGRFIKTLKDSDRLAVEATGNTRFFIDKVAPHIEEAIAVNPGKFEVIKSSIKKTDKNDARVLALFLSKDMLPEARLKNKQQAQISSLVGTRDKLVKLRTTLLNKIHNILNHHGIKSKKEAFCSEKALDGVLTIDFDAIVKIELKVLVEQIRSLTDGIRKLDEQVKDAGTKLKGHENLTSIKGIGDKSATVLLSVIGNIKDFADADKLASYFGIVPRVSSSNETEHHGRITKRGSKIGRTTLVQCTLVAKRYSPYLKKFYEKVQRRRGTGKAIIATARKFLGIIYETLKNGWIFEDFPNFVIANT
jgi:transposase